MREMGLGHECNEVVIVEWEIENGNEPRSSVYWERSGDVEGASLNDAEEWIRE